MTEDECCILPFAICRFLKGSRAHRRNLIIIMSEAIRDINSVTVLHETVSIRTYLLNVPQTCCLARDLQNPGVVHNQQKQMTNGPEVASSGCRKHLVAHHMYRYSLQSIRKMLKSSKPKKNNGWKLLPARKLRWFWIPDGWAVSIGLVYPEIHKFSLF